MVNAMFRTKLNAAVATVVLGGLVAVFLGCGAPVEEPPNAATPADVATLVKGDNAFAFDLYRQLCETNQGNLFLSPYSISGALAMTSAGARGDTLTEMETVLHFPPQDQLHPAFKALIQQMNGDGKKRGYQLSTANALWSQKGYRFLPEFLRLTKDHYGAGLTEVDFVRDTEGARQTINAWAERETQDKIKELFKPGILTVYTRLVLTNAIYFKGDWASPFVKDYTRTAPFTLAGGNNVNVKMMFQEGNFQHHRGDGFEALEMPYAGKDLAMLVLLPKKPDGLPALEKDLTADLLAGIVAKLKTGRMDVGLPRFKTTTEFRLEKTLEGLGMRQAFGRGAADFSGMNGEDNLFISAVVHKAFVEVNEEGTEAAAATGVAVDVSAPPCFIADHPFLFLIRDTRNGSVLFLGRINDPTKEVGAGGEGGNLPPQVMPPAKPD
jgi:serpin B